MHKAALWLKLVSLLILSSWIVSACNFPKPTYGGLSTISPATPSPAPLQPATPFISGAVNPKTDLSILFIEVLAVRVADDDGSRQANITPAQVDLWVQKANEIYLSTGIHFTFTADTNGPDWMDLKNTSINNLSSSDSSSWKEANDFAAKHPCKLTVFFRHGPGANPTGNGFAFPPQSGLITNFVAMPGFNNTSVIISQEADGSWHWVQNQWIFAHETGHFFGLYHTFPGWQDNYFCPSDNKFCGDFFKNVPPNAAASQEATDILKQYIMNHGNSVDAFDGDGLDDTPPDPGTLYYFTQGWDPCNGNASYNIGNFTFSPDRHNMMSYFACDPQHFTPEQSQLIRQTAASRFASCNSNAANIPSVNYIPPLRIAPVPITEAGDCKSAPNPNAASLLALQTGEYVYADGRNSDSTWAHVQVGGLETRYFASPTNNGDGPQTMEVLGCWVSPSILDLSHTIGLAVLPAVQLPAVQSIAENDNFSDINLSPDTIYFGGNSCDPNQTAISVRAQYADGIKLVAFFFRLENVKTGEISPWNEGIAMHAGNDGLYTLNISGDTLAKQANFDFDQAVAHYQFVIQPNQGDNIRSEVLHDLTLLSCGSAPKPGTTTTFVPLPPVTIYTATPSGPVIR